jgi:hypothetical protein
LVPPPLMCSLLVAVVVQDLGIMVAAAVLENL